MKRTLFSLVLVSIFAGLFSSCDDDVLTQDFSITLYKEFVVNTADTLFSVADILDAGAQSEDITKYSDHIEDFVLEKVTYELTAFNGTPDQVALLGTIDVADTNGTNRTNLTSLSNVNLSSLLNTETELPLNAGGTSFLVNNLKTDPFAVKVFMDGNANKGPLDFTVKFRFYVKMKAKIV